MSRRLVYTPRATEELKEQIEYLDRESPATADRFLLAAVQTAEDLVEFPEAFPVVEIGGGQQQRLRKVAITGFPNHLMFYFVDEQSVTIARVLHGARDLPHALEDDADGCGA